MRSILKCNRFTSIGYMLDPLKWLYKCKTKIAAKYNMFYSENKNGMCASVPDRANKICWRSSMFRNVLNFRPPRTDTNAM